MKWTQPQTFHRPDAIISSDVRLKGQSGFVPSYEKCPKEYSMKYLLSNEYMRIWFQERAIYEKDTYSALETIANEKILRRKHVLRRNIKKDPLELPPIKIKKFQNISGKIDNSRVKKCLNHVN